MTPAMMAGRSLAKLLAKSSPNRSMRSMCIFRHEETWGKLAHLNHLLIDIQSGFILQSLLVFKKALRRP